MPDDNFCFFHTQKIFWLHVGALVVMNPSLDWILRKGQNVR